MLTFWIVFRLPNGHLQNIGTFEHYCHGKCCKSVQYFLRKLKWFVCVCAGTICTIFPRSRWTRMDEAIDWVGVLSNVHGLLGIIYRIWFGKVTGKKPPQTTEFSSVNAASDFAAIADVDRVGYGLAPADVDAAPAEPAANAVPDELPNAPTPDEASSKTAQDKSRDRKSAFAFTQVPSLAANTCGLRMTCGPMFNFMHSSLDMGGAKWERLQCAEAAANQPREYIGMNAATCKLELVYLAELRELAFDETRWDVISLAHRTVGFRNQQFQTISAFACAVVKKHLHVHSNFPMAATLWLFPPTASNQSTTRSRASVDSGCS